MVIDYSEGATMVAAHNQRDMLLQRYDRLYRQHNETNDCPLIDHDACCNAMCILDASILSLTLDIEQKC